MFGLRQKLVFGFGGLVVILVIVSGLAIAVTRQHRMALDRFLYENWRSVVYGQKMIDALERLDDLARAVATNDQSISAAAAAGPLADFDANLDAEDHNITLKHEDEIAGHLTGLWTGVDLKGNASPSYRVAYQKLLSPVIPPQERAAAYATLVRLSPQVKAGAQDVINLNLDNMTPVQGKIKELADTTTRRMILLAIVGAALAVLFTVVLGRAILRPIQAVTASIQQIEQGNLDLMVQVRSRDELRQLAEAFNAMTRKLREFRRTDRAKLERTQRTTQLAVNSLPDAIAIINPDGAVELSNATAENLFALNAGSRLNNTRDQRLAELFQQAAREGRPLEPRGYESAIEVYDKDGQLKIFLPHAIPICETDGHLLGVTLVLADVTNLRRIDEMKSGLLSVVSHELKTPLTSIRMAIHLLLEERVGPLTAKQTELMLAAREDSDRLGKIIDDLLDMGRLESGRVELDLRPQSPSRLVSDAIAPLQTAFHDKGVTLTADVPADAPDVLADPDRIDHVFSNLLANALKYTPPGGQVTVRTETQDAFVRFIVQDTGMGIAQEHLGRIFDRFYRVPGASQPSGAGLGLAIAKEITELHGGRIAVESREGQGSVFSFTLKRAQQPTATGPAEVSNETKIHTGHG